jgi:branched-chain amino acid transport system ATP-binding protein
VTSPLLAARGIERHVGGFRILDGVDLEVPPRSLVALVGPNGAGKTTLFDVLSGLVRPTAGRVVLDGHDITGLPPWRIARLGIGRTFQTARPFSDLAVIDNVLVGVTFGFGGSGRPGGTGAPRGPGGRQDRARPTARARRQQAERLTEMVGLHDRRGAAARTLSLGEQKRLELALALALEPRLLLLDELSSGLSPRDREEVIRFYGRFREQGLAILAIEHSLAVLAELADLVVVLDQGRVAAAGPPREVLGSPRVQEAYFGEERDP